MRFLFIKLRHIGDALLLTPTLVATKEKFPDAEIWVLVRRSCEGILAGCPEIARVLSTAQPESRRRSWANLGQELALIRLLRRTRFDAVFELGDNDRGRWLALCARTSRRCTNTHRSLRGIWRRVFHHVTTKKRWPMHQVRRDYLCPAEVLELPEDPPPLRFEVSCDVAWEPGGGLEPGSYAVIHAPTRWPSKAWPDARWLALARELLGFMPRLVVSCGPDPEEVRAARELCDRLGERAIPTGGRTSWAQLGGILRHARFFVGVDTAAMHLAAAVGCPVVCLFGPSNDFEFHPWGARYWMMRPGDVADEATVLAPPPLELMSLIPVARVLEACQQAAAQPRIPA